MDGDKNPFGTYNHGPMITSFGGLKLVSWYNAPRDETTYKRSVFATSKDGKVWSQPGVLFPNFTHNGEENGPWTILNGRLYSQSGTQAEELTELPPRKPSTPSPNPPPTLCRP